MDISTILSKYNYHLEEAEFANIVGLNIAPPHKEIWDLPDDTWIYVGNNLLKWMGYENARRGKQRYLEILRQYTLDEEYKYLTSTEAKQFYSQATLPIDFNQHKQAKHIIVSLDCFKISMMEMTTERGRIVRKYYTNTRKAFRLFAKYSNAYYEKRIKERQTL